MVCFQYLLNLQRFIKKSWISYSMVGYGFQFAVFGFTDGANVSSMVPVIKVQLHIIFKRIPSRVGSWQISFQRILTSIPGDIWRGDRLSRALPLHLCYCILGRTPGGQWSISSKSIITRFSSCQGGRDIRHLRHIQNGLPWSWHTWGPWCPYSCRHYIYQKKLNMIKCHRIQTGGFFSAAGSFFARSSFLIWSC